MIFIAGYHPVNRSIGPIGEKTCPHCHNTKHWLLQKSTKYISLFFIPLIPLHKSYFINCPICNFKEEMSKEDFFVQQPLAELNDLAIKQNMSSEEYESQLKKLNL